MSMAGGSMPSLCRKLDSSMNDYHQKLCELVISYINEHYTDNTLCLNDIAASANVSPAYLSALFKNQGISISDFITSQRISAAARYLSATSMSLKEISLKCGYANQYYFSTSFKRKWGSHLPPIVNSIHNFFSSL